MITNEGLTGAKDSFTTSFKIRWSPILDNLGNSQVNV